MARGIRGVALIVINPRGEVMLLQEFESKPHLGKYSGMFSIPMETSQPGESDSAALARLVAEELPGLVWKLHLEHSKLGVYRIVPHVWVTLYCAASEDASLPKQPGLKNEVGNHVWMDLRKAGDLWLRQGARQMLLDYAAGCTGVVRRHCEPVDALPAISQ